MTGSTDRKLALRSVLVDHVRQAPAGRAARWRLGALISAVALAGIATGAASAAALSSEPPYPDNVASRLALSIARANSVALGAPFYINAEGETTVQLGEAPPGATGVAINHGCVDLGSTDIEVDGVWVASVSCDTTTGGSGWVHAVADHAAHTLTFDGQSSNQYEAWVVWVREPPLPTSSSQQKSEMADGVATRDEYIAAFSRFVGCMNAEGFDVLGSVTDDVVFDYAITDAAVRAGADELCYLSQFQDVDTAWQLQNEATSESTEILRQCLVDNGITPSADYREYVTQLNDAGINIAAC